MALRNWGREDLPERDRRFVEARSRRKRGSGYTGFLDLAPRTQEDYRKRIAQIFAPRFGSLPLAAMGDKRIRGHFLALRDELAKTSERQADYVMQVLSVLLSFAVERGKIDKHPLLGIGRVHDGTRRQDLDGGDAGAIRSRRAPGHRVRADAGHLHRPGDVLRLPRKKPDGRPTYDGTFPDVFQSKTKKWVTVPLLPEVPAVLDATPRRGQTILTNLEGGTWTYGGFATISNEEKKRLKISGASFGDARGTAVTRLRRAGASHPQIGAITGHSNAEINKILEKHYAAHDPMLAIQAMPSWPPTIRRCGPRRPGAPPPPRRRNSVSAAGSAHSLQTRRAGP